MAPFTSAQEKSSVFQKGIGLCSLGMRCFVCLFVLYKIKTDSTLFKLEFDLFHPVALFQQHSFRFRLRFLLSEDRIVATSKK